MVLVRRYQRAIELALLALVAYLGALGVSTAVRGAVETAPPETDEPGDAVAAPALAPLAAYAVIAERDVFNPPHGTAAPRSRGAAAGRLRLWGVGFRGGEARAVIEDTASHRQELYRVGDSVWGARLPTAKADAPQAQPAGPDAVPRRCPMGRVEEIPLRDHRIARERLERPRRRIRCDVRVRHVGRCRLERTAHGGAHAERAEVRHEREQRELDRASMSPHEHHAAGDGAPYAR